MVVLTSAVSYVLAQRLVSPLVRASYIILVVTMIFAVSGFLAQPLLSPFVRASHTVLVVTMLLVLFACLMPQLPENILNPCMRRRVGQQPLLCRSCAAPKGESVDGVLVVVVLSEQGVHREGRLSCHCTVLWERA